MMRIKKRRVNFSKTHKTFIWILAALLFVELIFVVDTQITGNPILKTVEKSVGVFSSGKESLNFEIDLDSEDFEIFDEASAKVRIEGFENIFYGEEFTGKPRIPGKIYNYILPEGKTVKELKINSVKFIEYDLENKLEFTPEDIKTCIEDCGGPCPVKTITEDEKIYSSDSYYPENYLEVVSVPDAGGYKIAQVVFKPVQYNPVQNKLRFVDYLDFSLVLEDTSVGNLDYKQLDNLENVVDNKDVLNKMKLSAPIKRSEFQNYFDENSDPEYLIITNDELKPAFEPLADWKRQKGIPTKIVTVDEIYDWVDENYPDGIIVYPTLESFGTIEILEGESDVEVYLDEEYKGQTPLVINDVPLGYHNLEFLKGNFEKEIFVSVSGGAISIESNLDYSKRLITIPDEFQYSRDQFDIWDHYLIKVEPYVGYHYKLSLYDFLNGENREVSYDSFSPKINDGKIIWFSNGEMFSYNISGDNLTHIETEIYASNFDFSGDYLIYSNSDIFIYSFLNKTITQITNTSGLAEYSPKIDGDYAVYQDENRGVYLYNLNTKQTLLLTSTGNYAAINGNIVTWEDSRNGDYDIYVYDIDTNMTKRLTVGLNDQRMPDVYGKYVVWHDWRDGEADIYFYDLENEQEFFVEKSPWKMELYPKIYEGHIIFADQIKDESFFISVVSLNESEPLLGNPSFYGNLEDQADPYIFGYSFNTSSVKFDSCLSENILREYLLGEGGVVLSELIDCNSFGLNCTKGRCADVPPILVPRDDPEKIKLYLRKQYGDHDLEYVLFGGDEDVVPIRYLYPYGRPSPYDTTGDIYYSEFSYSIGSWNSNGDGFWGEEEVDLTDLSSEIFTGRIPLHNLGEVENWVEKTINYEKNPGNGDPSYVLDSIFFAADQMLDYNQQEDVANTVPNNFNKDITTLNEEPNGGSENPTSEYGKDALEKLSEGYGIIFNANHGHPEGIRTIGPDYDTTWSKIMTETIYSTDPSNYGYIKQELNNFDKPSFWESVSCSVAEFDYDKNLALYGLIQERDVFVEALLKKPNSGAFAFVGNSRLGTVFGSSFLSGAHLKFMTQFYEPLGKALNHGNLEYLDRYLIFGLNLYGDPEVRLYTEIPKRLEQGVNVFIDEKIANIHVKKNGVGVGGVLVSVGNEDGKFVSFETDEVGDVSFDLSQILDDNTDELLITSYKYNTLPAETTLVKQYVDSDGDGYGSSSSIGFVEEGSIGYLSTSGDCDDSNPAVHPNAEEICSDYSDNDCDGLEDGLDSDCTCSGNGGICTLSSKCPVGYKKVYNNIDYFCSGSAGCCLPLKVSTPAQEIIK